MRRANTNNGIPVLDAQTPMAEAPQAVRLGALLMTIYDNDRAGNLAMDRTPAACDSGLDR